MAHPDLTSTLVPLGDGVILITKEKEIIKPRLFIIIILTE